MTTSSAYDSWLSELMGLHDHSADSLVETVDQARRIAGAISSSQLSEIETAALLFTCSSLTLNCAFELGDASLINEGSLLAHEALRATSRDQPLHYQCRYNIANAISTSRDLDLPKPPPGTRRADWEQQLIENRITSRVDLGKVRREYLEIGSSGTADDHTRSAAYCNLANMLDHSGRWAEAYDFYLHALEADPSNGNAAGNLAQLLQARIARGTGQTGHIAAVHDKYLTLAQELRQGTLEYTSAAAADRWDQMLPTESDGHLTHGLDGEAPDVEYRRWVAEYRLALSPAVEGLGTEESRWDSATIEVLYGTTAEQMNPPIFGAMNVLKSDYLVSRRLAFDAILQLEGGLEQAADDSGAYIETLDHSLYGTQYSRLLLAQRSALDVLDKTAVVANEHFRVGDVPKRVAFRGFWATKHGALREALVRGPGRALPNLALAELAADMQQAGMYAPAQALRNAGTHRIVHAALLSATGVTEDARSRVDVFDLVGSTVLALQVTRSAYLYLIDLVAEWNHPDDHHGTYLPYPGHRYLLDPAAEISDEHDRPQEAQ